MSILRITKSPKDLYPFFGLLLKILFAVEAPTPFIAESPNIISFPSILKPASLTFILGALTTYPRALIALIYLLTSSVLPASIVRAETKNSSG